MGGGITVAELVTKWGFDIDPKALMGLESKLSGLKNSLGPVGKGIIAVGTAATAIVAGVTAMVVTTARAGEEALKTSQKIGINIERYQELQYAAKMADVGQEELSIGLKLLSSKLYDASNGSVEARRSLRAVGISAKDSSGNLKSVDEVLFELADKFQSMPDGAKKTALAMDLLGRRGNRMIPMFNQGSSGFRSMSAEARRLGLVMNETTARRGEELMDTIKRLQGTVIGIKREIGVAFLPIVAKLAKGFLDWVMANREIISQRVTDFIRAFGSTLAMLAPALGRVIELGTLLFDLFKNLTNGADLLTVTFKVLAASMIGPFLIIDDIIAFFQGKDSLLGRFIVMMQKEMPTLMGKFIQFFAPVEGIFRSIGEQVSFIYRTITKIIDLLKSPAAAFFNSLGSVWGMNADFFGKNGMGGKGLDLLRSGLDPSGLLATLNTAGAGQANFLKWMDPFSAPAMTAPVGAMANGALAQVGLSMGDININLSGAGNPTETAAAVGTAIKDTLNKFVRQAKRDLKNTVVR